MKVPLHIVKARREKLATMITQDSYLPVQELCRRLDISEATVRRDLSALEKEKRIKRTYGGAISEFDNRFPSFGERRGQARRAKARISAAALSAMAPGRTYFLDTGTTIFAIAEAFRDHPVVPVKIVTPNIPAGELLATIPGVEVFLPAGQLLSHQSVLTGETTRKSLEFWKFDVAFLSAEAMNAEGIWNSQPEIVEQQKVVLRRSQRVLFCLDESKLDRNAPNLLVRWRDVETLLTNASAEKLKKAGINLRTSQFPDLSAILRTPPGRGDEKEDDQIPVHFL